MEPGAIKHRKSSGRACQFGYMVSEMVSVLDPIDITWNGAQRKRRVMKRDMQSQETTACHPNQLI